MTLPVLEAKSAIRGASIEGATLVVEVRMEQAAHTVSDSVWNDPRVEAWLDREDLKIVRIVARPTTTLSIIAPRVSESRLNPYLMLKGPGLYAFRDAELALALKGVADTETVVAFLEAASQAETAVREQLRELTQTGALSRRFMPNVSLLFQELDRRGLTDEAITLAEHMLDEVTGLPPRRASMAHDKLRESLPALTHHSPEARRRLSARRDALMASIDGREAEHDDVAMWLTVNVALGDHQRVIDWAKGGEHDPALLHWMNDERVDMFAVFIEAGAWALAGRTRFNPVEQADAIVSNSIRASQAAPSPKIREFSLTRVRRDIADLHAACLAAGRVREAEAISTRLFEADPDAMQARVRLLLTAANAGLAWETHLRWLKEVEEAGIALPEGLRERIEANFR